MDIGWKGTIQDHLFKLYDKEVNVKGFYLGLVTDLMQNAKNTKKGLVFDYQVPEKYDVIFKENIPLFEVFLGASHGSADYYSLDSNNKIIPITHEEQEEHDIFEFTISPMQNNVYEKFIEISNEFKLSHYSILDMKEFVAENHGNMILFPSQKKVRFFRNLYHYENFGLFEFSTFDKYRTNSFIQRLKYIKQFVTNPRKFLEFTFWKAAALDDIGLLSVYKIYNKKKFHNFFKKR